MKEKPIGLSRQKSLLDSHKYLVCFKDGVGATYTASLIAECLYLQMDKDGRRLQVIQEIVDHEKNNSALREKDVYY